MAETPAVTAFPDRGTRVSGRRLIAHITDGVLVTLIFAVLVTPALVLAELDGLLPAIVAVAFSAAALFWIFVGHLWWFVRQEARDDTTVGKRSASIKVVTADGGVPSRGQLWKRTVPLLLEYVYLLAFLGMMFSKRRQRFGDRWGRTYVVDDQWEVLTRG